MLGEREAQLQQGNAEQFALDAAGRLALDQHSLLPGVQQMRIGADQCPGRGEKQQAAPVDVLPQPCEAGGEQPVGLLAGMPADQHHLTQRPRHVLGLHRRYASQQRLGALQADAAERDLEAFRWLAIADAAIGFLNEAQRQHRAVLNQLGNLPHRLAGVAQRQAHLAMNGGEGGQGSVIECLDPGR